MSTIDTLLSRQLSRRRIWFTREDALALLPPPALTAALSKHIRKGSIANPRKGFYLTLSPQDKGAPAGSRRRW